MLDDRLAYLHAEEDAKIAGLGLWVEPVPTPPWDFRKLKITISEPLIVDIATPIPSQMNLKVNIM